LVGPTISSLGPKDNFSSRTPRLTYCRKPYPDTICTGFSEKLNEDSAKSIGIKGFLMKPVVKSEMASMIRKVLEDAKDEAHV